MGAPATWVSWPVPAGRQRCASVSWEWAFSAEEAARLRSPAGLDIGAETPGEIALSILAQIVEDRRSADKAQVAPEEHAPSPAVGISLAPAADDTAVDPICGMTVSRDSPHRAESGGQTYWFCCPGCAETFAAQMG